ncbi:CRISPR-associated Csd1 family protein [Caldinitratiruptor microaerophilus]|uniref:CRISPR-associated Csd1 family protein n=2 Tax=Caldinitratiruptor microaerophilus TaxID=671077 RepID=A0AA35G6R4_9FIRM|nr:CRISPR-associated Csd1 family protein [Caldinitratiruptor microaerophilus]
MLLQRLNEYADRLRLPPPMYGPTAVRWVIHLDTDGRMLQMVETTGGTTKSTQRGKVMLTPQIGRTVAIRAKLLADNGEYVLGIPRKPEDADKVVLRHRAFIDLVRECALATGELTVKAVLQFLEGLPHGLRLPSGFDPADNITFEVAGIRPIDLPVIQRFWAKRAGAEKENADDDTGRVATCLVCGELKQVVARLPFKLKSIPGGQTSGIALVSANAPAFESYGLEASHVAPICHQCAERTHKSINALLADPNTHLVVGPIVYVAWTREPVEQNFLNLLSRPDPAEVRALIASVYTGRAGSLELDDTQYYAVAFSASGGRAVVRDWLDTTVGEVRRNLARFFMLQRIIGPDGNEPAPLGIFALSAAAVRDASRDLPPELPKALIRCALAGTWIPSWILAQAIRRARVEQRVTRQRAALIRLSYLSYMRIEKEDELMQLDRTQRDPAYHCGRLLAVLEEIQHAAVPGAKATLLDRFYGAASASPATVFGTLFRTAQSHLGKLRKDRPRLYNVFQQRLMEVQESITYFPATLNLGEQALFTLGYYHQRAADLAAARARSQKAEDTETDESDDE